jgi:hypothetical protein
MTMHDGIYTAGRIDLVSLSPTKRVPQRAMRSSAPETDQVPCPTGNQEGFSSAFLTLPLQAAVAIYFISRRLSFSATDLIRATLRSSIVTACSWVGVMLIVVINGFSFTLPALGLVAAAITGVVGWWLGLSITRHPLQAHLRSGANGIWLALRKWPFPLRVEAVRSAGPPV